MKFLRFFRDGEWYFSWGTSKQWFANTDIHVSQPSQGNDFIMFTRGNDTLVLRQGFGNDMVAGFDTDQSGGGGHDRIDVSAYGFTAGALGVDILLVYDGESTTVKIGDDSVKLLLVDINTLDGRDFIFS